MNVLSDHCGTIINHARDIVLIFDASQRIVDFNQAALSAYGYSAEELRCMTASDLRVPQEQNTIERDWDAAGDKSGVLFETVHRRKDGTSFPVEVSSNQSEIQGQIYRQSFVRDITQRKVSELALYRRKTRALSALSRCTHVLISAREVQSLLDQICNILVTVGGYRLAWVGKPESDDGKRVSVWAKAGTDTDYLEKISISWADIPLGRGPTGTALREVRTVLARNLTTQTDYEPWRQVATQQGFAASIAIPLSVGGRCLAALTVYTGISDVFDSAEITLLEELARNVAYGMADLQTREHAQRLQDRLGESDRRFQMLIEQSPAGIYVVRHGIFVYANPHMDEIMGLKYGELIGKRAQDFVLAEDWHILIEATERMKQIGTTGNLQVRCRRKDGVTIEIGLQNLKSDYEGAPAIIGMAQDISERSRTQAQIKQYILKLERTTETTLQAVSAMVEKRDPYTAGHERRVGELAGAIGVEMGLSDHQIKGLRLAGFVHDLGKIAVPAELLAKPTRLSEAEMALVRVHPQVGYDVLKEVEFAWPIADVILQHHERLDGTGYPRGLAGDDIILEARIMMVADVVESMSSHRPYRAGLGVATALEEITRFSGVRYDPAVVAACRRLFLEKGYTIIE